MLCTCTLPTLPALVTSEPIRGYTNPIRQMDVWPLLMA